MSRPRKRKKFAKKKCWSCNFFCHCRAWESQLLFKDNRVLVSKSEGGYRVKEKEERQNEEEKKQIKSKEKGIKFMKLRAWYADYNLKNEEGKGNIQWMT